MALNGTFAATPSLNSQYALPGAIPQSSFLRGTGFLSQTVLAVIFVVLLYVVLMSAEQLYQSITRVSKTNTNLVANTLQSTKQMVIKQNPTDPASNSINLSDNERSGIEFSYSFFLQVDESSFINDTGLLSVFHKGYSFPFPLLGPGVFLDSTKNSMKIYMGSTKTWNNCITVDNIPVGKWFHCVVLCRKNALEVYVNGNLSKKMSFKGSIPYINFGDIYVFSQRQAEYTQTQIPSTGSDGLRLHGPMTGMISRLHYYSYALSFTEINSLMAKGPSSTISNASSTSSSASLLTDTYWTSNY